MSRRVAAHAEDLPVLEREKLLARVEGEGVERPSGSVQKGPLQDVHLLRRGDRRRSRSQGPRRLPAPVE